MPARACSSVSPVRLAAFRKLCRTSSSPAYSSRLPTIISRTMASWFSRTSSNSALCTDVVLVGLADVALVDGLGGGLGRVLDLVLQVDEGVLDVAGLDDDV